MSYLFTCPCLVLSEGTVQQVDGWVHVLRSPSLCVGARSMLGSSEALD